MANSNGKSLENWVWDAAENEEVEVHGTLWLIEQMVSAGLIRPKRARQAYDAMRKAGRRLPWDEVEDQLRRFE